MPLSRQLMLLIVGLLLLLLAGLWLVHYSSNRTLAAAALATEARQQLAQLAVLMDNRGGPAAEHWQLAVDALPPGSQLTLRGEDGSTLLHQAAELHHHQTPAWFRMLYHLEPAHVERPLANNRGLLALTLSPTLSYRALWQSGWHFVAVALGVTGLGLIAAHLFLRRLLKPLVALAAMSRRLGRHESVSALAVPTTRELREVIVAFNSMTDAVRHLTHELEQRVRLWRQAAFADEETGLANRRAFLDEMTQVLGDPDGGHGMLVIVRLNRLELHHQRGFGTILATWKQLLPQLPDLAGGLHYQCYRTREEELALLLHHASEGQVRALGERLHGWFALHDDKALDNGMGWIGISLFARGDLLAQVLSEMDLAVEQAQHQGRNAWYFHGGQRRLPLTLLNVEERRHLIQGVVSDRRFAFCQQPVLHCAGRTTLYQEWLPQFHDGNGKSLASSTIVALARQFDCLQALEEAIIEGVATMARNQFPRPALAINLDPLSLLQGSLLPRLEQLAQQDPQWLPHLLVELDERRLVGCYEALHQRLQKLRSQGLRVVLDHFGAEHASFTMLTTLRPDYVKLDGRLSRALGHHPDHLLFLQALLPVCARLGMEVIAAQVENEPDLHALNKAGIHLVQGFVFGQPRPVTGTISGHR